MQKFVEDACTSVENIFFLEYGSSGRIGEKHSIQCSSSRLQQKGLLCKEDPMRGIELAGETVAIFIEEFLFQDNSVMDVPDESGCGMVGRSNLFSLPGGLLLHKELAEVEQVGVVYDAVKFAGFILFYGKAFSVGIGENSKGFSRGQTHGFSLSPKIVREEVHELIIHERANIVAWKSHKGGINQRRCAMTKAQLLKKIAVLESINDQLSTEVEYVDRLMRLLGFSEGLLTVKSTAQEIIEKGYLEENNNNEE